MEIWYLDNILFNLSSGNTLNMSNDSRGCIIIVDGDAAINGTIKVRGGYGGTPADTSWVWGWIKSGETSSANNTTSDFGNGSTDGNGILPALSTFMSKMPQTSSNSYNFSSSYNSSAMGGGAPNAGRNKQMVVLHIQVVLVMQAHSVDMGVLKFMGVEAELAMDMGHTH